MTPAPQVDRPRDSRTYTADETEFLRAVSDYQARTGRRFPTFVEILGIAVSLGYRKPAGPGQAGATESAA